MMPKISMVRLRSFLVLGIVLAAAACAGAPVSPQGPGVRETSLGKALVDADGMTLYTFDEDTGPASACTGFCAFIWPPATAPASVTARDGFSIITRADGTRQWAHNGDPLYGYIEDDAPGDVEGDGVDGVWHIARP